MQLRTRSEENLRSKPEGEDEAFQPDDILTLSEDEFIRFVARYVATKRERDTWRSDQRRELPDERPRRAA